MALRSRSFTRRLAAAGAVVLAVSALLAAGPAAGEGWLDTVRDLDADGRTREALARLEERADAAAEPEVRLLRGVLLAKLGRTDEARELYQRLILEHPDRPEAYNNLAVMHAAAGDYESAIEILKRGLGTHPSYRTTYENLTRVYGKLAGEAYSKALGDDRIDDQPLRLALIKQVAGAPATDGEPAGAAPTAEPEPVAEAEPTAAAPVVREPVPPPPAAEPAAGEAASDAASDQEVWRAVEAWAAAWAGQRVDDYLSFYADGFEPPGGMSRSDWERQRRQRLSAPEFIRISLALLEVERPAPDRAVARFVQSYESDRFSDTVTKALELVGGDGTWRIVVERVEEPSG